MSGVYFHTMDPFALEVSAGMGIRWYGLAYLAGFYLGFLIIRWLGRKGLSPLPPELAGDFVFEIALGTVIGGRLGYCLFYSPGLLTDFSSQLPFWGVLRLYEGGMASHGGMIGIIVAAVLFARKHRLPMLHLLDLNTLGGALGIFFGRIANFINGELVGRPAPEGFRWAVKFPQDIFAWPGYEPERLPGLEPVVGLLGVPSEQWASAARAFRFDSAAYQLVNQSLDKVVTAVQGGNQAVIAALEPLITARYPSQLYAAGLEGLLIFLVLGFLWRTAQKPGVIAGCFFTIYGVVRIFGEQFRMPDAQIGYQLLGLTRGQWLSIGMLFLAVGFLVYAQRREAQPIGGWAEGHLKSQN